MIKTRHGKTEMICIIEDENGQTTIVLLLEDD